MISCTLAVALVLTSGSDNWPSFHNGGNTSVEIPNLPVHWSPEEGIAWSVSLPGYGQSSPVIWDGRVYLTAVRGANKEKCVVVSLDAKDGRAVWQREFDASVLIKYSSMVSRAAPTPVVDSRGLYVFFESGDLLGLDHDGNTKWQRSLAKEFDEFKGNHGIGSSPTQTDDAVIVLVDHAGPSYLLAVSKASGENFWKVDRPQRTSWTSPQIVRVGDRSQVIVSSNGSVDAYDAATGKMIWSHTGLSGNTIPSATIAGDRLFVGASVGRRDANADSAATSNCCLRVRPDLTDGYEVCWKAEKAVCNYSSPLVHRGHVYYVNSVGVCYCLDAATGEQRFAERIDSPCWAQPIASGEHIFFFGKNGVTTVLKAGPEFDKVATNLLWHPADAPIPEPSLIAKREPPAPGAAPPGGSGDEYLDPLVYGVAASAGAFFVRIGTRIYRIERNPPLKSVK